MPCYPKLKGIMKLICFWDNASFSDISARKGPPLERALAVRSSWLLPPRHRQHFRRRYIACYDSVAYGQGNNHFCDVHLCTSGTSPFHQSYVVRFWLLMLKNEGTMIFYLKNVISASSKVKVKFIYQIWVKNVTYLMFFMSFYKNENYKSYCISLYENMCLLFQRDVLVLKKLTFTLVNTCRRW